MIKKSGHKTAKMEDIIISDKETLEEKIKKIAETGKEGLHVLADFDRTLTKAFVDGEKIPSLISELRNRNYINEDYSKKAHELFNKYHPIEVDPNVPFEEKKAKMHEWWSKHFELLIKSGLNKKHLKQIVDNGKIQFREGVLEFLDYLHEKDIPLIILSSAGLGGDSISMFLEKHNRKYDNIHIISNSYVWDSEGNAVAVKEPIIHSLNKSEITVKDYSVFDIIKNRKNVLLLGDGIGDLGMVEGFPYDTLISIGFLNEKVNENLETYKKNFDVVITNDGSMSYVNKILEKISG